VAKLAVTTTVEGVLSAWPQCPARMRVNEKGQVDGTGTLFLLVQYPVANGERWSVGRDFTEVGGVRFVIHAERGSGTDESQKLGEEIAKLFRGQRINGIEFGAPTSPLINDANDAGAYFKTSVVVPYVYHFDDAEEP
jgi:hypothetical protein